MRMVETYFLWFVFYSILGWVYETILCSTLEKRFINRGFLNGPYCPIYGFGALIVIVTLRSVENVVLLFLMAAVLTSTLEYITSWGMEKLFHARWWDYSHKKWNINGRV
ncbi:MAG TPA: putative ABC transporter permease, partial [Clostridiales bacterium]|nr:putative ABC transporter permease [Clostridiales bacterium]